MSGPRRVPRFRVLVVDDDAGRRERLGLLFAHWGWHAVHAADAASALAIAEEMPFDVVVTDPTIVTRDGTDLAAAFAARPYLARTPFIYLTAEPRGLPPNVIATVSGPDPTALFRLLDADQRGRLRVAS